MARNLNLCFTNMRSPPSPAPEHHNRSFPTLINNTLYDHFYSDEDSSPENIATAFASSRFFFSSPGRSNSIVDSASSSSRRRVNTVPPAAAVPTYSPDPFRDFRRSMEEMVEARGVHDVRQDWDYLHQLLTCYLSLNPKTTHKFILGAFADLLVGIVTSSRRKTPPIPIGKHKIPRTREKAVAYGH